MSFFISRVSGFDYGRKKGRRHRRMTALAICLATGLTTGCGEGKHVGSSEDRKFEAYTYELFCRETSSDTINLHYTLKEPEEYGIEEIPVTFGEFCTDEDRMMAEAENIRNALDGFQYEELSMENRITYDIIEYSAKEREKAAGLCLYDEPLGSVGGIQTQLPVVLSEYRFYDREDVETYLKLLETTGDYFDSLVEFEREKAEAGLFMSDSALDLVLEQCRAFLDMGPGNYLYSTFADRVQGVKEMTDREKSEYIQDNAGAVDDYVLPAYEKLITSLESMRGSGENEKGLAGLPEGKRYYELAARKLTGTDLTVREMEDLARRQIADDLTAMEKALGIGEQTEETAAEPGREDAKRIILKLEQEIEKTFPEAPETKLEVKYVPEEMEEHLSPAFYMIPAIDYTEENVIYINEAHMGDSLTLFTTLAHEGYPGHLYQTIYYESTDPDPVRNVFHFGGYVEGWATYAEMCSYHLAPLEKEQAVLLQKNSSIILGLYALADLGIHYEGWSREDTAAFFANYGIKDAETTERIYELIIGSPGNYLQYYFGYVQFLELKKDWVEEKGEEFSQKQFHEAVLKVGPAPFDIVEKYMWEMAGC